MDRVAKEDRGYAHIPVMLEEVLALAPAGPAPWILDATFGRGVIVGRCSRASGPRRASSPSTVIRKRWLLPGRSPQKTLALPWWPVPSAPWPKPWRPIFKAGGLMAC